MYRSVAIVLLCGLAIPVASAEPVEFADPANVRQYYAGWMKAASKPYYYRNYYYKKAPADKEYSYHYAIYYPSRGKKVYMYNPQTKKYWGYWDGENYSLLPQDKQKASIDDIAAEDFPKPGKAPTIPDIDDAVIIIPPPNDFPKIGDDKP